MFAQPRMGAEGSIFNQPRWPEMSDCAIGTAGDVEAILTVENRVSSNERMPAS